MATTLNINLPNNWWYNSGNTPEDNNPKDGFFNLESINAFNSIGTSFPGFITPYTTGDIHTSCSFSNPGYTVDYLTITFTPNNSEIGTYSFEYYSNWYSYYFNWSESMTMKISAKINGSTTTNLIFNVTNIKNTYNQSINFDYYLNYGTFTLSSSDQVNNSSPSNTVFTPSNYKVYLSSASSTTISYPGTQPTSSTSYPILSTPYFPIVLDITTSVGTDNSA